MSMGGCGPGKACVLETRTSQLLDKPFLAQLSGLALFAETVWVTADQYRVYPLMGVSGKDDVFAGAWIAIFCGFSFFVVASFGVGAALCRRRYMILTVRSQDGDGSPGHRSWVTAGP